MRSPSVDRLICSSSAARDLLPPLTLSAQLIRLASTSFNRSSREMGAVWTVDAGTRAGAASGVGGTDARFTGCEPARSRMLADIQPTRTVPHEQVWAIRSHAFSSSRTLPGQEYRRNACLTASETGGP